MNRKLLYLALSLSLCTACDDFLDVKPVGKLIPTQVSEFENLLNNEETVNWYYIDNNGGNLLATMADNFRISKNLADYSYTNTHPNIDRYATYIYKLPYRDPNKPDMYWEKSVYASVGLFNNVIDGIYGIKDNPNPAYANSIIAQAMAARAWGYLTMSLIYGPIYDPSSDNSTRTIPYRTAGDPTISNPPLSTTAQVFEQAKEDIDFALENAPDRVGNPCRFGKTSVQALAAYYYMFTRDWENMLKYADMAWTGAVATMGGVDNLIYNFKDLYYLPDESVSPSPGTDAEVSLELRGPDNLLNQTYHREILMFRRAPSGIDYAADDFLNNFDQERDLRYRLFALKALGYSRSDGAVDVNDGVVTKWYRGGKMTETEGFSYPELLLMRAEAYARLGKNSQALADLNTLRARRYDATMGSTDLENGSSMSSDELLDEILKERRRELPIGSYQRCLDLKRLALDAGKPWCKRTIVHELGDKTYSADVLSEYFILPISNVIKAYNPEWGLEMDNRPYNPKE